MADVNQMILEKSLNYTMNAFDGFIYHPDTKEMVARCDALSESGFSIATELQEKRGGQENAILFSIPSSKTVTANLTNLAFDETWLSLATGEKLIYGKFTIYGRTADCNVTDNAGVRTITLPEIPVGKYISIATGATYLRINLSDTPTAEIDVTNYTGVDDKCLKVVYAATVESEQMDINGSTAPTAFMLVLKKKVRKGKGGDTVKIITITLPNFQPDGNLELTSTLGDSDTMSLNGTAQAAQSTECGGSEQALGSINIETIDPDAIMAVAISTASSYEVAETESDDIQVWASKGSDLVYEPFDVTDKCTFVSEAPAIATVDATGKITGVSAGNTTVTITYQNLTTIAEVSVI